MKERLAIIGANSAITMLIKKAKKMGYETHVFAWKCGDPGESEADHFYPISIDKKDAILQKCKEIGVSGVCSITSDYAAPTVNYVASNLGLTCNPEETDTIARNKYQMRCAFKKAGLYTPFFMQVSKNYNVYDLMNLQFPVIVKPTDRWSSKGVTRVDNLKQLGSAIESAIQESFDNHAIIEGFMDGPEYSAECICFRGNRHIVAFTQKQTTGYPHYIETGHIQPSDLSEDDIRKITPVILRALEALKIENGAAHAEFRLLADGTVGIIEIGARMGGDCIGTDLTPASSGLDYIRMVIDVACGKEPDFTRISKPCPIRIVYIMTEEDYEKYTVLKASHGDCIVKEGDFDFDFGKSVRDSSTRHGYYIITGDSF